MAPPCFHCSIGGVCLGGGVNEINLDDSHPRAPSGFGVDRAACGFSVVLHPQAARSRSESMSSVLPTLYLARHGDTAWTDSHQHTGRTDLPLNERGEEHARRLGERLRGSPFVRVFTSPLRRASRTCELAGFG